MADDKNALAQRVIARRGELGLTQAALATAAKVSPKTIYSLESARRVPQASTRGRIERILGWDSGTMEKILDSGEPTPPDQPPAETPQLSTGERIARAQAKVEEALAELRALRTENDRDRDTS